MTILSKIKKILGIEVHEHEWVYFGRVKNPHRVDAGGDYWLYRYCASCKTHQIQEIHCLGLNPPKYLSEWWDCDKPKIRYELWISQNTT